MIEAEALKSESKSYNSISFDFVGIRTVNTTQTSLHDFSAQDGGDGLLHLQEVRLLLD